VKEIYSSSVEHLLGAAKAWLFPVALFPHLPDEGVTAAIRTWDALDQSLLLGFATTLIATVLSSYARPLYRVLEGYSWPGRLADHRTQKQRERMADLRKEILSKGASRKEINRKRWQLELYPRDESLVLPTRLGNALRSGEAYGGTQYGLETINAWHLLVAVAPEAVVSGLNDGRTATNTWVGGIALSAGFAIAAVATAIASGSTTPIVYAVVSIALTAPFYQRAVSAAGGYARAMRALIDLGRLPLAEAVGLDMPATLAEETHMWKAFSNLSGWGRHWPHSPSWISDLDVHRSSHRTAPDEEE